MNRDLEYIEYEKNQVWLNAYLKILGLFVISCLYTLVVREILCDVIMTLQLRCHYIKTFHKQFYSGMLWCYMALKEYAERILKQLDAFSFYAAFLTLEIPWATMVYFIATHNVHVSQSFVPCSPKRKVSAKNTNPTQLQKKSN